LFSNLAVLLLINSGFYKTFYKFLPISRVSGGGGGKYRLKSFVFAFKIVMVVKTREIQQHTTEA
jgi:hypothetical protein